MVAWVEVRRRVAMVGRVTDAETGRPLGGAQVEITAGPRAFETRRATGATRAGDQRDAAVERLDRTRTAADGHFRFMGLPNGRYRLRASLRGAGSRYGVAQATAVVAGTAAGSPAPATIDLALPPTRLQGRVTRPDDSPVALAQVQVEDSGERTFTDKRGRYVLAGLEPGKRTVRVSAPGHRPAAESVRLTRAGRSHTLNVVLSPTTA